MGGDHQRARLSGIARGQDLLLAHCHRPRAASRWCRHVDDDGAAGARRASGAPAPFREQQQPGVAVADVEQEVEECRSGSLDAASTPSGVAVRPAVLRHGPPPRSATPSPPERVRPGQPVSPLPAGVRSAPVPSVPGRAPRPARAAGHLRRGVEGELRDVAGLGREVGDGPAARRRAAARGRGRPPRLASRAATASPSTAAKASPTRGVRRSHPSYRLVQPRRWTSRCPLDSVRGDGVEAHAAELVGSGPAADGDRDGVADDLVHHEIAQRFGVLEQLGRYARRRPRPPIVGLGSSPAGPGPQAWIPPPSRRGAATVARRIEAVNGPSCPGGTSGAGCLAERPAPGAASDASSGRVRHGTSCDRATTLVERTTAVERLSSTRIRCRPSCELAATRQSTSPLPVVACASRTPGIAARSRCTSSRALGDLQGDERLDAELGGGDVDVRPETGDHAGLLEPLEPRGSRRPGDAEDPGDLLQTGPGFSRRARRRATSRESRVRLSTMRPLVVVLFRELSTLHSSTAGSLDRLRRFVSPRHTACAAVRPGVL